MPAAVSIHQIDAHYDSGPLLACVHIEDDPVCDERMYITTHATHAGALCARLLAAPPISTAQRTEAEHTWARIPQATDYTLEPHWTSARVKRFVALTDLRAHPYWIPTAQVWVDRIGLHGEIPIPCADGTLYGTRARSR